MELSVWDKRPLSKWRIVVLILNYFIGFIFLYPFLLRKLALWLDPYARTIPLWMQLFVYVWMIVISVVAGWPILKESYERFKLRQTSFVKMIVVLMLKFYACTIVLNLVVMLISQTETSANQAEVLASIELSPWLMLFTSCIYAPIVEEILFRGVFFRCIRSRYNFLLTASISAFSFGFIHVMNSLASGNINDLWYIFSYALIGSFMSYAYEKSESIYGSMVLHCLNNTIAFLTLFLL